MRLQINCRRLPDSGGFSLVELLVTMVVVSLVIMAATTTFIVQNKMATIQAATSDVQLTGQLTMDLLSRDIRMAGYGMDKATALVTLDNAPTSDVLRTAGTDAIQLHYSTPVLPSSPAGTRGSRRYNYYVAKTGDGGLVRQDSVSGGTETIASNVEDMQIVMVDDSTSGKKRVTLKLVLKSTAKDNQLAGDGYRRREYSEVITPKNYGL